MSKPDFKSCKIKLSQWQTAKTKHNTLKNDIVPPIFREKCPCILLNNYNASSGKYFDKMVKESDCQNKSNNNTHKYNYDKYIGEYTSNNNSNGRVIYYIYIYYDDDLLNFINSYKHSNYFTVRIGENNTYISVSSYYKDLIKELVTALHKQASNKYNTQGNKANNIPLYPIPDTQTAGSRKKVKTHRKKKIVTINKKNRKTKKHSHNLPLTLSSKRLAVATNRVV